MTLTRLMELARHGAAMETYATFEEYEEIHDFAKTWRDLAGVELDDLDLRKREEGRV